MKVGRGTGYQEGSVGMDCGTAREALSARPPRRRDVAPHREGPDTHMVGCHECLQWRGPLIW
jgi:hypothetical protein